MIRTFDGARTSYATGGRARTFSPFISLPLSFVFSSLYPVFFPLSYFTAFPPPIHSFPVLIFPFRSNFSSVEYVDGCDLYVVKNVTFWCAV